MKQRNSLQLLRLAALGLLGASLGLPARADYSTSVLAKNPVGYWRLNQTNQPVLQEAINYGSASPGANGFYLGGASAVASPLSASSELAPAFDGVGGRVEVPFAAALNPASAFTAEAWVKPTCIDGFNTSWYRAVMRTGGTKSGGGYQLQFDAGNSTTPGVFKFTLYNSTSSLEIFNTNLIGTAGATILATNNGPWAHLVGSWNSADGVGRIYVNGVELTNRTFAYSPTTNALLRIGAGDLDPSDAWGQSFDPGAVSQVAVYDHQLSAEQIAAHYANGINSAPSQSYASLVATDTPLGYWPLNEPLATPVVVTNLGSASSALNGKLLAGSTAGVSGPQGPNYGGLESDNRAGYVSASVAGAIVVPPVNLNRQNLLSIVAWIKRDGFQMANANIFGRRITGGEKSAFCFLSANQLAYNWDDAATQYNFDTKLTVPDGVWTMAALVITPTNTVIYMDTGTGLQAATNLVSGTNVWNARLDGFAHDCLIGPAANVAGRRYNGAVDEVAVFTNALTMSDLWELRNAAFASGLFFAGQPSPRPVMLGGNAPFSCMVAGATNYFPVSSYQLLKDGQPVGPPSSSPTLVFSNVQAGDLSGSFKIAATVAGGISLTSSVASLQRATQPGTYSESVEQLKPAAYYCLNESSGLNIYELAQGLDGALIGAYSRTLGPVAPEEAGFLPANRAYSLNGGYIPALGPAIVGSNVTVAMWVNPSSGSQIPYSGLYFTRGAVDYAGFGYGKAGNTELGISWNGHYNDPSSVFAFPGEWNFVAYVIGDISVASGITNATTFYDYCLIGGTWQWQSNSIYGSGGFPARNLPGGYGTAIGADPNTGLNRQTKGLIDEVAVFNRSLSFDEINSLAMAGLNTHLSIQPAAAGSYQINWSWGTLQSADSLSGPWSEVPAALAPAYTVTPSPSGQKFYRAQQQ